MPSPAPVLPDLTIHRSDRAVPTAHLRLEGVSINRAGRRLLDRLDLTVSPGDRLAVVGENGTGKSSLLLVMAGLLPADDGAVDRSGSLALVHQTVTASPGRTVGDLMGEAVAASDAAVAELDAAAEALAGDAPGAARRYEEALEEATRLDAWDARRAVAASMDALGAVNDPGRALDTLSVGQRHRVRLACALANRHDLLLLDEPTNHLDVAGLDHLTEVVRTYPGAVVLVTHDRVLLDHVANRVVDLDPTVDGRVLEVRGSAGQWQASRTAHDERWRETHAAQVAERAARVEAVEETRSRLSTGWRPDKGTGKHQRQARTAGIVQQLHRREEELERARVTVPEPPPVWTWPALPEGAGPVLGWAPSPGLAWTGVHPLRLSAGEHRLLVGPNGAGKSTVLRALAADGAASPEVRVALLDQETPAWAPDSVPEELWRAAGAAGRRVGFLTRDVWRTPVGRLSEGQRRRLHLELVLASRPHVLLLDEPTNHLSMPLVASLTDALQDRRRLGRAAVVVATHDRQMVSGLDAWERWGVGSPSAERQRLGGQ